MSTPPVRNKHKFEALSRKVIAACIDVQRQLGVHCMELDYQRALALALPKWGLQFEREVHIPLYYDGVEITKRRVDFCIWDDSDLLLLETKARSVVLPEDVEQCLLYLRQGGYGICLLVNFGQKPLGIQRFVHTPPPDGDAQMTKDTTKDAKGAGIAKDAKGTGIAKDAK